MTTVASTTSVNTALVIQEEIALLNTLLAQSTPVDLDGDIDDIPAVFLNFTPGFLDQDQDDLLIAELLSTLIAVNATALNAVTV
jgi:hypothetical protein